MRKNKILLILGAIAFISYLLFCYFIFKIAFSPIVEVRDGNLFLRFYSDGACKIAERSIKESGIIYKISEDRRTIIIPIKNGQRRFKSDLENNF